MMNVTDDVVKALQKAINSFGSMAEFSRTTNVQIETLSRFLTHKSRSIRKETWDKLYPLLKPHLGSSANENGDGNGVPAKDREEVLCLPADRPRIHHDLASLTSDEKILLDAFACLSPEEQTRQLLAIVELAKKQFQTEK